MTLEDIKTLPVFQTRTIAEAAKDPDTLQYILKCLYDFYAGNYGEIPAEDVEANNNDLKDGEGHILARYKKAGKLDGDIYINAEIYAAEPDNLDGNNVMIMYCNEY